MTQDIETRLQAQGITLPTPAKPAANYVPYVVHENLLYISGQLPMKEGVVAFTGQVGQKLTVEEATEAAKLCAVNILAQAKAALQNLNRIDACIRLGGFVSAPVGFADHPKVINGASDLIYAALGEKGAHTRIAVGASSLPLDAAVEIDAIFAFSSQ